METLSYIKEYLHIDPIIVLLVIGAGFFQGYYLKSWTVVKDEKTNGALKTLIMSLLFVAGYIIILSVTDKLPKEVWANYFVSYILATSLYELLIRPLTKWIQKRLNKFSGEPDNN